MICGRASFISPHEIAVENGEEVEHISADHILLGVGARPARPLNIPFNGKTIFTSDEVMHLDHLPKTMLIVGGCVIGTEYACITATLGVQVTLIEGRNKVLGFLDQEIARGQLLGDEMGMLKMLIHQETHELLGVHVIGTGATELIHIGQAVMTLKGNVEFFVNNVFNSPTLAECYKVAACNGLNKLNNVCSGSCQPVAVSY